MGMLAVMGMVLALDGFGPIADNAAGIAEMAGERTAQRNHGSPRRSRQHNQSPNKRFRFGSALLAAQLLFQTYAAEVYC